jgi:hypothetical protein
MSTRKWVEYYSAESKHFMLLTTYPPVARFMQPLTERKLASYPCPVCKSLISGIVIKEEDILQSKRSPAIVPARCPKRHDIALYIDKQFMIRDAEPLIDPKKTDRLDKAADWVSEM